MKVLLHDDTPAYLAHGGKQVMAAKLLNALRDVGVDVEFAQWWNPEQAPDVIHSLGCTPDFVRLAHQADVKVVRTHIVDTVANASRARRAYLAARNAAIRSYAPDVLRSLFSWTSLAEIDRLVYINAADQRAASDIYGVGRGQSVVIPHGCDSAVLDALAGGRRSVRSYIVSTATVGPRKNSLLLALAARTAQVPVVFLGKPYSVSAPYFQEFMALVDGESVIYPGYVNEDAKLDWLRDASGFALLSSAESGCIAAYEAAAAGLPMLLADRPWARTFDAGPGIELVDLKLDQVVANLASFFAKSCRMSKQTFPVFTWEEVAQQYVDVYVRTIESERPHQGEKACSGDGYDGSGDG